MKMKTAREIAAILSTSLDNLESGNADRPIEETRVRVASVLMKTYKERREYAKDCKRTPNIPELE